jgi:hypothetical protein
MGVSPWLFQVRLARLAVAGNPMTVDPRDGRRQDI